MTHFISYDKYLKNIVTLWLLLSYIVPGLQNSPYSYVKTQMKQIEVWSSETEWGWEWQTSRCDGGETCLPSHSISCLFSFSLGKNLGCWKYNCFPQSFQSRTFCCCVHYANKAIQSAINNNYYCTSSLKIPVKQS